MADPKLDVPTPDPTTLTTVQLDRAIECVREIIETRLHGMDAAIELLQSGADKWPHRVDEKISALSRVHEEKFSSIQTQFKERDVRTEQSSKDSKVAVDAALQAQKEQAVAQNQSNAASIAKSEAGFTKQIDQLGVLIQTTSKGLDDKIADVKERLTLIDGRGMGTEAGVTSHRLSNNSLVSLIAMLIGMAGLIFGIFMAARR